MRSSAHIGGHPLHPMLVGFPAAYLFGAACVDVWAAATNRPDWARTARHLNTLGLASALAAAVPGLVDYVFAVPPASSARRRATNHLLSNVSALTLFGIARAGRDRATHRPAGWAIAAEMCGAGLVAVAGWLGGTLVYRNQIGVDHRYANAGKYRPVSVPPIRDRALVMDQTAVAVLQVDQMRLVHAGAERVALARTETGLRAVADRCTHRGGPLSDGAVACGVVQCPWHGSQFDLATGEVKQGPATEPVQAFEVNVTQSNAR